MLVRIIYAQAVRTPYRAFGGIEARVHDRRLDL
jgi:hypothetical protein